MPRCIGIWHKGKGALEILQVTGWRAASEIERQAGENDVVIVDTPPHAETEARIAVRNAHLAVVPVQPNPMDVWATKPTLEMAAREKTRCFWFSTGYRLGLIDGTHGCGSQRTQGTGGTLTDR